MDENKNLLEILRNFLKIFKSFLRKLRKMHYFTIFSKNKLSMRIFARLDEKSKLIGNFEKILKTFGENSKEKFNFYFPKFVTKN